LIAYDIALLIKRYVLIHILNGSYEQLIDEWLEDHDPKADFVMDATIRVIDCPFANAQNIVQRHYETHIGYDTV